MKTSILITGSTGFLGKNLENSLINNYKIISIVKKTSKKKIKNKKNLKIIYYKNYSDLYTKLKNVSCDYIIHCATYYKKKDEDNDMIDLINSNILFGSIILSKINSLKVKKFINITTNWENYNGKLNNPFNLYSATKIAFKNIVHYFQLKNKKIKFYNIYLSDTFGYMDNRKKIIPSMIKAFKENKKINLISANYYLNILNVQDFVNVISIIIKKNIKQGNYNLVNNKYIILKKIVEKLKEKKEFKVRYISNKLIKEKIFKFKNNIQWQPKKSNINNLIELFQN